MSPRARTAPAARPPIKTRHNVPVLGWLVLRGRCATCQQPISARYPLVEAGTGALFAAVTLRFGLSRRTAGLPYLAAVGVTLAMIDFDVRRLPDSIVLPSYVVASLLLMPAGAVHGDWRAAERALLAMGALIGRLLRPRPRLPDGAGPRRRQARRAARPLPRLAVLGGAVRRRRRRLAHRRRRRRHGAVVAHRRGTGATAVPLGPCIVAAAVLALFVTVPVTSWYGACLSVTDPSATAEGDFRARRNASIGLDIGSTSIRAVEATRREGPPGDQQLRPGLLPDGAVVGGVVKDDKAVTAALRQLWTHAELQLARRRPRRHPPAGRGARDRGRRTCRRRSCGRRCRSRCATCCRCRSTRRCSTSTRSRTRARTTTVQRPADRRAEGGGHRRRCARSSAAGLHVAQVDLSCFAALRAAAHLAEDTEAVIDIGANGDQHRHPHATACRRSCARSPRGGAEITKLMASRLGMSATAEAEALKCRVGLIRGEGAGERRGRRRGAPPADQRDPQLARTTTRRRTPAYRSVASRSSAAPPSCPAWPTS